MYNQSEKRHKIGGTSVFSDLQDTLYRGFYFETRPHSAIPDGLELEGILLPVFKL